MKFANFVAFVLRTKKAYHFATCSGRSFSRAIQKYKKIAKFTGLYFPHFMLFRNQTLQFYDI